MQHHLLPDAIKAIHADDVDTFNSLILNGFDIHQKYRSRTLLMEALWENKKSIANFLIDSDADLHDVDVKGLTAMHFAAGNGYLDIVKKLEAKNLSLTNKENTDGHDVLLTAAQNGHLNIIEYCLNSNINIETSNNDGHTALHLSAYLGNVDCVNFLIERGANIDAIDKELRTPLMWTAGYAKIAQLLIDHGANIHLTDKDNFTVLHYAVNHQSSKVCQLLVDLNININVQDNKGCTALHHASEDNELECFQLLIAKNADYTLKNKAGETAFDIAIRRDHQNIIDFFDAFQQEKHLQGIILEKITTEYLGF